MDSIKVKSVVNLRLRLGLTQGQRLGSLISEPSRRTNRGEGNEAITGGGGGYRVFTEFFFYQRRRQP